MKKGRQIEKKTIKTLILRESALNGWREFCKMGKTGKRGKEWRKKMLIERPTGRSLFPSNPSNETVSSLENGEDSSLFMRNELLVELSHRSHLFRVVSIHYWIQYSKFYSHPSFRVKTHGMASLLVGGKRNQTSSNDLRFSTLAISLCRRIFAIS